MVVSPTEMSGKVIVVSCEDVDSLLKDVDASGAVVIPDTERRKDQMDDFNHPRIRRALILTGALQQQQAYSQDVVFEQVTEPHKDLGIYESVHTKGLLQFLSQAWEQWDSLGLQGQDPMSILSIAAHGDSTTTTADTEQHQSPPLIPGNAPLFRDPHQRPSNHVMGQIGYYCTDNCTPIFADLMLELTMDAAVVARAVALAQQQQQQSNSTAVVVYAIPTHPGHHAAADSFGGYCYVNHAAAAARLFSAAAGNNNNNFQKVAILDIDYHAGNGTASIFYECSNVFVVSIHCHPDHDYPFHSGFADQTGGGTAGVGATLHLPLPPDTLWKEYETALQQGLVAIQAFGAQALVVSMGLDTHDKDPCAIRRAGFCLQGDDYKAMGEMIGAAVPQIPTVFLQEGGYRMDKIGQAAADVVCGFQSKRKSAQQERF